MASLEAPRSADPARRRRLQTTLRGVIALALASFSLPLLTGSASAAPALGLVIDGDRAADTGRDWDSLTEGTAGFATYADPLASGTGQPADDIFQSASEPEHPSGWGRTTGRVDTGDDIGRVYTYETLDAEGHVWFYLGFERSGDGVGAFSVELNKQANDANGMPNRSVGDVRITFEQSSGNTQLSDFGVHTWDGAEWDAQSVVDYAGRAGEGGLFAELAIDLTEAGLQPGCDQGFTQVNLRSRASAGPSSLKDYVKPLAVDIDGRCQGVRVEKYDATSGDPLGGAGFRLFADDGDGVFEGAPADRAVGGEVTADGGPGENSHTWEELGRGTYFVMETTLPEGYESDPDATGDAKKVVLDASAPDGVAVVRFDNPQTRADLRVAKYDADTGAPLQGASFRLFADDGDGVLTADDQPAGPRGDHPADQGDDRNSYTWENLPYGTYFVQESVLPTGYLMDPGADADGVAGSFDDHAKRVTLRPADADSVVELAFHNPPVKPSITVEKHDATTGDPLGGAGFTLYADDGDGVFEGAAVDLRVGAEQTADQGAGGNSYTWAEGLAWGTYFVEESTVPEGYASDPAASLRTVTVSPADPEATARFDNPRGTGAIQVRKWDWNDRSSGVTGATFQLWSDPDCDGNPDVRLGGAVTADEELSPGSSVANSYTWPDLPWGCYVVEETAPPAGYDYSPEGAVHPVEVERADVGTVVPVDVHNMRRGEPARNAVVVEKYDADSGELVDGATFELYRDRNRDGVGSEKERVEAAPEHTGVGTYEWSGLKNGDYLVREAAPPAGYSAPESDVQSLEVKGGELVVVAFHNAPILSEIVVTKLDATTQRWVDEATFQLWMDDGDDAFDPSSDTRLGEPRRTDNGDAAWRDLRMGTYFVEETVAPVGYELADARVLAVTIDAGNVGGTFRREFVNPRKLSTIQVVKKDEKTGAVLAGAVFQAYLDADRDGVGAESEALGEPRTTDSAGVASWSGLGFGRYIVDEVAAPAGYGLPEHTDQTVVVDRENAGSTIELTFLDPRLEAPAGDITVTKLAFERDGSGGWSPSDGRVRFGATVRYVIVAEATGNRLHEDVRVVDVVPGHAPWDRASTTEAAYVKGSATCTGAPCQVSYDKETQLLTWSLGDLRGETRRVEFLVRMPRLPFEAEFVDGLYTEKVVNVADLMWRQTNADTAPSGAVRSNRVVTTVVARGEVLPAPPGQHDPEDKKETQLPDAGAPRHSSLISTVGVVSVILGAWLMLVSRRRGLLPQQ